MTRHIHLSNVSYKHTPVSDWIFQDLTISFAEERIGIVGANGVGKSTLLDLILGRREATLGGVARPKTVASISEVGIDHTVASCLGIAKKLEALSRIEAGSTALLDFEILQEDWSIRERAQTVLELAGLAHFPLMASLACLSGGERIRLQLHACFEAHADFLILDEPSNHLDIMVRDWLYSRIDSYQGGLIIASHDRALLDRMDRIVEITRLAVNSYGGNYSYYKEEKQRQETANAERLKAEMGQLKAASRTIQGRLERHGQDGARAGNENKRQLQARGKLPKHFKNARHAGSEATLARLKRQAQKKLGKIESQIEKLGSKLYREKTIMFEADTGFASRRGALVEMTGVSCAYGDRAVIEDLDLRIDPSTRLAIIGSNGSGKSTLLKIVAGLIDPSSGLVLNHSRKMRYLDQDLAILDETKSLLEHFIWLNPDATHHEAHATLAKAGFRDQDAAKRVSILSSGERLRATIASLLMGHNVPDLLLLDEPSNHLDIESVEILEEALRDYSGAMVIVSHDSSLLDNIGVDLRLELRSFG